jgi:hypothetical protein
MAQGAAAGTEGVGRSGGLGGEAGRGLQLHGVCGGWARGEGWAVLCDQGHWELEVREIARAGCWDGFGREGSLLAGEQHADVVAADSEVACMQHGCLGTAQRGEQDDEAGEMARAEFHFVDIGRTR